jgi:hypothetical protein
MAAEVDFRVEHADIADFAADVVALKYAGALYGADGHVTNLLVRTGAPLRSLQPDNGRHALVQAHGAIKARHVLFVGVPPLVAFRYPEIQAFATSVLTIMAQESPSTRHIAMTIHGTGYGLDEVEAFHSILEGCLEALANEQHPQGLSRISIVDHDTKRVARLRGALAQKLAGAPYASPLSATEFRLHVRGGMAQPAAPAVVGVTTSDMRAAIVPPPPHPKSHAFVAMPFTEQLNDVFYYGIQAPVHKLGLLCERIDNTAFTGAVIDQIKSTIATAAVVIAELSDGNPNVFLEVGYAWGKDRPTILLTKSLENLPFDVKGHKCLVYQGIKHLEDLLDAELLALKARQLLGA